MYFTKVPHKSNFSFSSRYDESESKLSAGERRFDVCVAGYSGDVTHIRISNGEVWDGNKCLSELCPPTQSVKHKVKVGKDSSFSIHGKSGRLLLKGVFGVSGEASMFCFKVHADSQYLGLGEKNFGRLELSDVRTKF